MLTPFKRIMSLANLDCGCVSGQIATLLVFLLVIVLVMALVTINLGQLANWAMDLSNAADAAVLTITNQLATYAQTLYEAMGNQDEICNLGGIFQVLLLVISVVIGMFTGIGFILTALLAGGVLAAARGIYYGSADAALSGFLDGVAFAVVCYGGALAGPALGIGAAGGAIVAGASATANWVIQDRMKVEAIEEASRQLNGLAKEDQIAQGAIYTALISIVNDPNTIQDYFDSDGNGDTQELVPYFQFWWERRIEWMKSNSGTLAITTAINAFLEGAVKPMITYLDGDATATPPVVGALENGGLFWRGDTDGGGTTSPYNDGSLIALLRATQSYLPLTNFWFPGPSKTTYNCWVTHNCCPSCASASCASCASLCPPSASNCFDDVDKAIAGLTKFDADLKGLRDKGDASIATLVNTWNIWLPVFYDPVATTNYYNSLNQPITKVQDWETRIENKRSTAPATPPSAGGIPYCILSCTGGNCYVTNFPCKGPAVGCSTCVAGGVSLPASFGTINANLTDEFAPVQASLQDLIVRITAFKNACYALYTAIQTAKTPPNDPCSTSGYCKWSYTDPATGHTIGPIDIDYGGTNPVTYWWCDSVGYHEIRVSVAFTMPHIETDDGFIETCTKIADKTGTPTVTIQRLEPKVNMGLLGPWNPLLGPTVPARTTSFVKTCSRDGTSTCRCNEGSVSLFRIQRTGTGYYAPGSSQINN